MKKFIFAVIAVAELFWMFLPTAYVQEISEYRIAFASDIDVHWDIYLMDVSSRNRINLTNSKRADYYPSWSPDGERIAFFSIRDGNNEIYVMDADGGNQTNLSHNPASDKSPCWSPDGTRIVFGSNRDGNYEIYVMDADGNRQIRLTDTPADEETPAWSPDSKQIAFASKRDGNSDSLWVTWEPADPAENPQATQNTEFRWSTGSGAAWYWRRVNAWLNAGTVQREWDFDPGETKLKIWSREDATMLDCLYITNNIPGGEANARVPDDDDRKLQVEGVVRQAVEAAGKLSTTWGRIRSRC